MSDLQETFLDPDKASPGATQLSQAGETLATAFSTLSARINSLNASAPWGGDEAGVQFADNYAKEGDGASASTLTFASETIPYVSTAGTTVTEAINGTINQDQMNEKLFGKDA